MEAKQLLLEKTKLTEEFDDINISVTKLLTDMGNASEIKSIADKCLKATKNEFSKQVETFTIYENSTLSLHESVKALMAECEQLNEDLKTKENASENMKQKIEEAQKSIAEIDNELHQYIKLRQKRKYDSDGVPENSETELEKLKKKNEILHLLSGMQIFEFEDKYEGVLIGRYNERMKCFDCPKQQDPKLSTTNLLWDNIREFYSQGD
ncbi:Kinesin-like protein [Trichinella spiralis]|uniref:Kinesin-like protein n=1 Tax=Trichinella spiralis TaxID=6334 RepID=A0ABR3KKH4_TRISP